MKEVTYFIGFNKPNENKLISSIINEIKNGTYKNQTDEIRNLIITGEVEKASTLKKNLIAFTPSATFRGGRKIEFIENYNQIIVLDFDNISNENYELVFDKIKDCKYTYCCFRSPSGNGIKVLCRVNSKVNNHKIAFNQLSEYYENLTEITIDPSGKDITRLCYVSYDPDIFYNEFSRSFEIIIEDKITDNDIELKFKDCKQFTNKKASYTDGNRNNYIYLLASNCNRVGLSQTDTELLCRQHYDLPEREIQDSVKSAYSHHTQEHKKFELKQKATTDQEETKPEEKMPTLPDAIFDTIPEFLKRITEVATTNEERDILLLGSLVTLSVAFPKLIGNYGDNPVNANLFIFISAKASAGKGILIHCRKLIVPIHLAIRQQAKLIKQQYEVDLQEYNKIKGKGKDNTVDKPQNPPQKMLFIPANNSSTGFFELLNDSDGIGIIFETEADTLSKSFKSEHGNFSDGLRNAFQHEPHSYYRRTDKELVEIPRPCLSVMLSGTPKQVQTLIPSAENGLFSRFMFYVMNMKLIWKDVFASKTENGLDVHFEKLGNEFYILYQTLQANPDIHFSLKPSQQLQFNNFFEKMQILYVNIQEEDIISSVRRLGLIAYRIMMIFSALRIMEDGEITTNLYCNDSDFQNTLDMITILVKHSSYVYSQIVQETYKPKPKHKKEQFLENLPYYFNRHTYLAIAINIGIPDKSAQRYIKEFKDADIIQYDGHDQYTNPNAKNPQ